jgi:hypothetical protein
MTNALVSTNGEFPVGRQTGSYPETGLQEIKGDLLQADFWPASLRERPQA